jgi:hypothetical protein
MEKLELQYKSRKIRFQYVLDGSTLLLDGPNLTTDVKRFGFLVIQTRVLKLSRLSKIKLSGFLKLFRIFKPEQLCFDG